ncbi:hypothetical protein HQQ81_01605 [Microbacteriaceae bacterium VKM Ac-2854]|nr:hypothetical protein [Microbacteriaceae bacterium VKM Ac-2854]
MSTGGSNNGTDLPWLGQDPIVTHLTAGETLPIITFSGPCFGSWRSFTTATDIITFTGPGGANLSGCIGDERTEHQDWFEGFISNDLRYHYDGTQLLLSASASQMRPRRFPTRRESPESLPPGRDPCQHHRTSESRQHSTGAIT